MQVSATFLALDTLKTQCMIIPTFSSSSKGGAFKHIDQKSKGALSKAAKKIKNIAEPSTCSLLTDVNNIAAQRVLILGLGKASDLNVKKYAAGIANAIKAAKAAGATEASIACGEDVSFIKEAVISASETNYVFDDCKSTKSIAKPLAKVRFVMSERKNVKAATKAAAQGLAIANGMTLAKTLSNLPGNICTPTYLADAASDLARGKRKLKTTILNEAQMKKLGMGSLLSVSRGSRQPAKLIVMEYKGGKTSQSLLRLLVKD
jgi:leucyl aminopeptidase